MKITFKYKLFISISLIVISVLAGTLLFVHADIEEDALLRVKTQLNKTKEIVLDLLEARWTHLNELAVSVGASEGLHDFVDTPALSRDVGDKIIRKEILPNFPRLSLICIIGPNKKILGANNTAHKLHNTLIGTEAFRDAFNGRPGHGFVFLSQKCIQLAAIPIFFFQVPSNGTSKGCCNSWNKLDPKGS